MAFTTNKICRNCKLKDRCDESALMRSYVTSADEDGCPKYKSIIADDEISDQLAQDYEESLARDREREERAREIDREYELQASLEFEEQKHEYVAKMLEETGEVMEIFDDLKKKNGTSEPTEGMSYEDYFKAYLNWSFYRSYTKPFESPSARAYYDFLMEYDEKDEAKKIDLNYSYNMLMNWTDDVLKKYREYGISGPGAKDEKIHAKALQEQALIDEKEAAKKAEAEKHAEEERKRKEAEKQKKAEARKKKQQEDEERRKRLELEEAEEEKQNKKKALIFWGIVASVALILFACGSYVLAILGLIIAAGVRIYKRMMD